MQWDKILGGEIGSLANRQQRYLCSTTITLVKGLGTPRDR